ncbi:hypothetical protein FRX31_033871, partial [Thalictrum thalictroides]
NNQYSDQAESERAMILERFRQATLKWNQDVTAHTGKRGSRFDLITKVLEIVEQSV